MRLTWIRLWIGLLLLLPGVSGAQTSAGTPPANYEAFYTDLTKLAAQTPGPIIVEEGFTAPPRRPLDRDPYTDNSLLPREQAEQTVVRTWGYRIVKLPGVTVLQKRYDLPSDPPFITLAEWEQFDARLRHLMDKFGADAAPKDMAELGRKLAASFTHEQYGSLAKGVGLWELTPEQQELVKRYTTASYVVSHVGHLPNTKDWLRAVLTGTAKAVLIPSSDCIDITLADGRVGGFYPQGLGEGTPERKDVPPFAPLRSSDAGYSTCRVPAVAFLRSMKQDALQLQDGADQHLITVLNGDKMTPDSFAAGLSLLFDLRVEKNAGSFLVRTRRGPPLNHLSEFPRFCHQMLPLRLRRFLQVETLYADVRAAPEGQLETFQRRLWQMQATVIYQFGALEKPSKEGESARKQALATVVGLQDAYALCSSYLVGDSSLWCDWARLGIRFKRNEDGEGPSSLAWLYPFPPPAPEPDATGETSPARE